MADQYLNLSGLQAFYDKLKTTAFIDSALDTTSTKPVQNKVVATNLAAHETSINTLTAASAGWNAKQDAITDLDSIRNSAKSGWSAWSAVTANSGTWATDTNTIAGMTDVATYFDGVSAIKAKSATSATNAANATNASSATKAASAGKLSAARNIAASGGVTWSVSFDGSTSVTGAATVNSVPAAAISSVPWSAIDDYAAAVDTSTTNKFTTPKAVNDAITAAMGEKASFKGPYATRGDIPSSALDKLSIYLIGPSGSGVDKYEEWVLTGTTTAQMLQIGDTSTDLSDYLKTTAFTAWSGVTSTLYSGTSRSAKLAGSAATAANAANAAALDTVAAATVTGNAAKGAAASAWITAHSGDYASSSHDHAYTLSGAGTALNISAGINLKPNGNIAITTAANTINISAKDTTYSTLNSINTAQYAALTAVSGLTGMKNYSIVKAGTSDVSPTTTGDTLTFSAKTSNISVYSAGVGIIGISASAYPTVYNSTISITTGASPATGSFSTNTAAAKTITLGSMALKASGDYMATGSMVPYTSAEVTAGITW